MQLKKATFFGKDNLKLCADICGDAKYPPVIFLHGGGQTRHSWRGACEQLAAAGYYCISLDMRGHGDSDWSTDGRYGIDDIVGDLMAIIAPLRQPPILVGASLGGIASMVTAASQTPSLASALILVDIVPKMESAGIADILNFMTANPNGFASLEEGARAIANYKNTQDSPSPRTTSGLHKNLKLQSDGRYYWHWDPQISNIAGTDMAGVKSLAERMKMAASHIKIPTLIVRGINSNVVSMEGVKELIELIPQAQFKDIPRAGHMIAGDNNDQFVKEIVRFIKQLP